MNEFPIDSAIIAVVISVGVTLLIVVLRERKFEPERWKKTTQLETIEKQIMAYGKLLNFLQAAEIRSKNYPEDKRYKIDDKSHVLNLSVHNSEFNIIFENYRYLYSDKIIEEYLKILESDEDSIFEKKVLKTDNKFAFSKSIDLSRMQNLVTEEFEKLKMSFEKRTGRSLNDI